MSHRERFAHGLPQLVCFAVLAAALSLAELSSSRFAKLMQEDGAAEWATFLAFAIAGGSALHALLKRRVEGQLERLALLGIALFCLFVAGEEISWGQRVIGFRPPALFLEHNFQQESNLHNLLKGILETRWMVFMVAVGYGVLAPYLAQFMRPARALAAPLELLPFFAAIAWLEFSYPYELVGELCELMMGLCFLADVSLRCRPDERHAHEWGALTQAVSLAGALLLVPAYDYALSLHSDDLVAHTETDLRALGARIQEGDVLRGELFRKRDVHKRLYTAVRAGYLALDPSEFYLDPWNSPYWVSFQRSSVGAGRLTLYSFGPNRKRDLDAPAGDDVLLSLDVSAPARAQAD